MSFLHHISALGGNPDVRILSLLHDRPLRFSDLLCNDSPSDESALSASLRELDRAGLVMRHVDAGPPLRVMYALTPAGVGLVPTLEALAAWLEDRASAVAAHSVNS